MLNRRVVCGISGVALVAGMAIAQMAGGGHRDAGAFAQMPPKVRAALLRCSKGSRNLQVQQQNEGGVVLFKGEWKYANRESKATVTADGDLVSLDEVVGPRDIPPLVAQAAKTRFPDQANMVVIRKTTVTYEVRGTIDGKRQGVAISPLGKVGEAKEIVGEDDFEQEGSQRPGEPRPGSTQGTTPGGKMKSQLKSLRPNPGAPVNPR